MYKRLLFNLVILGILCVSLVSCDSSESNSETSVEIAIGQPCEIPSGDSSPISLTGRTPTDAEVMWNATDGSFEPETGLITTYYAPTVEKDAAIQLSVQVRSVDGDYTEAVDCTVKAPIVITATPTVTPLAETEIPTYTPLPTYTPFPTSVTQPTTMAPSATAVISSPTSTQYPRSTANVTPIPDQIPSQSSFGNLKEMGVVRIDLATNRTPTAHFTWEWDGFLNEGEYLEVRAGKKGEPLRSLGATTGNRESYYSVGLLQTTSEVGACSDFQWQVVHMAADKQTEIANSAKSDFEVCIKDSSRE